MSTYTPSTSSINSYVFNNSTLTSTNISTPPTSSSPTSSSYNLIRSTDYFGLGTFIGYPTQNSSSSPSSVSIPYGVYLNSSTVIDYTYSSITQLTLYNDNYFPIIIFISTCGANGGNSSKNIETGSNRQYNSLPAGGASGGNLVQFTITKNQIKASIDIPIIFMIYTKLYNDPDPDFENGLTSVLIIENQIMGELKNTNTFLIPAVSNGGSGTTSNYGIGSSSTSAITFETISYDTYNVGYTILSNNVVGGTNPQASAAYDGNGTNGICITTPYLNTFYVCGAGCAGELVTGTLNNSEASTYGETYSVNPNISGGGGAGGYINNDGQKSTGNGFPGNYFGAGGGGASTSPYSGYGATGGIGGSSFACIYTANVDN